MRLRTAEISLRMAFGATGAPIMRLMVGNGMRLGAAGLLVGVVAAPALTRAM